jgi:hypothetical protein
MQRNNPTYPVDFPASRLTDAYEREEAKRALTLIKQGRIDESEATFKVLLEHARQHHRGRHLAATVKRTALTWVRMPSTTVLPGGLPAKVALYLFWLGVLGLGLVGLTLFGLGRPYLVWPFLLAIGSRTLMPFVTAAGCEPRYLYPALPALFLFAAFTVDQALSRLER